MLTLAELKRRAGKIGVPQPVLEKDYALSVALYTIAGSPLAKHVVFKGGTALKKVYFGDARFSEDLDFAVRVEKDRMAKMLRETFVGKTIGEIAFGELKEERTDAGLKVSLKFIGPLQHPQRIRFDFSFRENLAGKPDTHELIDDYGLGKREISVLGLEELLAEKVHALGSRAKPRDLYDVWFLLERKVKLRKETVAKKFAYYHEKFDRDKISQNIAGIEPEWARDLERLLQRTPDYGQVADYVRNALNGIGGDDPVTTESTGVYNPRFS